MNDIIGLNAILFVSIIIIIFSLRWPEVSKIILIALFLRILVILSGHYFLSLPDSTKDALGFEALAWSYAENGFYDAVNKYPGMNSYFYSWVIGIIYSLFGRSILMAQAFGLLFGIATVFTGWLLAKKIWDNRTALKIGWILALFPSLVLYSSLPLREVYSCFFILVAILGIYNWVYTDNFKSIFLTLFGFIGATFFHGPLILGGIVFLFIVGLSCLKSLFKTFLTLKLNIQSLIIIVLAISFLQLFFLNKVHIPKIGYFEDISLGWFVSELRARMAGEASYGDWANINSKFEIFYKVPLRIIYFLFSPFLWDIQKPAHIIGLLDGFLYLFLSYLIFCNRKFIWNDPFLRILFIILVCYFFAFAIGVSNFGSGIRHRAKFIAEIVLLAGPLIPSIVFDKKNRLSKFYKSISKKYIKNI